MAMEFGLGLELGLELELGLVAARPTLTILAKSVWMPIGRRQRVFPFLFTTTHNVHLIRCTYVSLSPHARVKHLVLLLRDIRRFMQSVS